MPAAPAPARPSQPFQPQPWRDRRIAVILGNLLRTGVLVSAAVVLLGASIYLSRHAHEPADYHIFRGEPSEYRTIRGVIQSVVAGRGRGQGLIQLGLLLLIATPIARVAFSVVGFAIERDRLYVVFTLIVLAILLYSFLGSGIGL
ncbi:MAG TPA: DUF1634 domain-containing protein [Edaphobacter sp.]|jgi:uncharacterized membrane protein|nr:DUF1634 domain-containing protein [Edaphobacter sp.]